jgi:integrase
MPERWRAFFMLLARTGLRISELLGLTWRNVHLRDDAHLMVEEQVYKGGRKRLKTDTSRGRVPISPLMAAWLTAATGGCGRPAGVPVDARHAVELFERVPPGAPAGASQVRYRGQGG